MKIALVVPRCGNDIFGGAESLTLDVARNLARTHDIEILTTRARDASTWKNHYPARPQREGNLTIRRFQVDSPRDPGFVRIASELDSDTTDVKKGLEFLDAMGPVCRGLEGYISENHNKYDVIVFVGYLYWTTYHCIRHAGDRGILLPTAHDEPWIHYSVFRDVFDAATGFAFLTESERQFVDDTFGISGRPFSIVGHGISAPSHRHKTRLKTPSRYILYVGRINSGKGCQLLSDHFNRYADITGTDLGLVMVGDREQRIDSCRATIYQDIPDADKLALMQNCEVFVMPSFYESLNMACLEAWLLGRPVLANSCSEVLRRHCQDSDGGLYFDSYDEFSEALTHLLDNPDLAEALGQNGRKYVQENYNWPDTIQRYQDLFAEIIKPV